MTVRDLIYSCGNLNVKSIIQIIDTTGVIKFQGTFEQLQESVTIIHSEVLFFRVFEKNAGKLVILI